MLFEGGFCAKDRFNVPRSAKGFSKQMRALREEKTFVRWSSPRSSASYALQQRVLETCQPHGFDDRSCLRA